MSAQRDHWTELASRETEGLLVSLHWSSQDGDLKVAVADLRLRTRSEFAVAADCALDAYHHPLLYAGSLDESPRPTVHRRWLPDRCLRRSERKRPLRSLTVFLTAASASFS